MTVLPIEPRAEDRHQRDDVAGELRLEAHARTYFKNFEAGVRMATDEPHQVDAEPEQAVLMNDADNRIFSSSSSLRPATPTCQPSFR